MSKLFDKHHAPFESGRFYHVFNRGNNRQKIFYLPENYRYFLIKLDEYLSSFIELFAYCLISNHFHFLVRVKRNLPGVGNLEGLSDSKEKNRCPITQAFSNFFNAYSKAINKQQSLSGSLFQKNFNRILIEDERYLLQIIYYIHNNPMRHKICNSIEKYKWSSYLKIIDPRRSKLKKDEVITLFGDKESYINFHKKQSVEFGDECELYLVE